MKPTKERMQMLKNGNVFDGLEGISNASQKRMIETQRHCQFMDMTAHIHVPKIAPEVWATKYLKTNEKKFALKHIEDILKSLAVPEPHPINKAFLEMEQTKKNIEFYTIAYSYIKNHYGN